MHVAGHPDGLFYNSAPVIGHRVRMHYKKHPMHAHIFFHIIETIWIFSYIIIHDPPKHSNTLDVENFLMGLSFHNVTFHLKSQITNIKQNCLSKYSFACMISNLVE